MYLRAPLHQRAVVGPCRYDLDRHRLACALVHAAVDTCIASFAYKLSDFVCPMFALYRDMFLLHDDDEPTHTSGHEKSKDARARCAFCFFHKQLFLFGFVLTPSSTLYAYGQTCIRDDRRVKCLARHDIALD